jgi:hypothetical protein
MSCAPLDIHKLKPIMAYTHFTKTPIKHMFVWFPLLDHVTPFD